MKNKLIIASVIIVLIALGGWFIYEHGGGISENGARIEQSQPILLAANFPLSGELAFYGEELRDGLLMAIEEHGEKLPEDVSIQFDWGDNRFSPRDAATVLQRQLQQSPTIYTSALKPQVMAIENEVAEAGIPHLAWVLDLTPNPTGTTNNFRTWVSFKLETDVFFEHAKSRNAETVVLSYVSLPSSEAAYGEYLAGRLRDELGADVRIERFNPNVGADDFRNIATRIAAQEPDLVMLNGFIPQMVGVIRGLRPLGVIEEGNTMAALDMLDAAGSLSPEESEGIVVAAPPFLIQPDGSQQEWQRRFEQQYGRSPSYHAAFAYDAGLTVIDAAGRLELPASHDAWLQAILATNIDGVTGPIRFGSDQSQVTSLEPAIYQGGELVPLQ